MRNTATIPRKLALTASTVGLLITTLVGVTPAKAGNQHLSATINGPVTVESGTMCFWTSTTTISNPLYEWSVTNGGGTTTIGTSSSVSYVFDRANGAHQGLDLRVYNLAGAQAEDHNLIGVYFPNTGTPQCYS